MCVMMEYRTLGLHVQWIKRAESASLPMYHVLLLITKHLREKQHRQRLHQPITQVLLLLQVVHLTNLWPNARLIRALSQSALHFQMLNVLPITVVVVTQYSLMIMATL